MARPWQPRGFLWPGPRCSVLPWGWGSCSGCAGSSQGCTGHSSPDLASPPEQGRARLASPHHPSPFRGADSTGLTSPHRPTRSWYPRPLPSRSRPHTLWQDRAPLAAQRPRDSGGARGGSRGPSRPHLCPAGPPGMSRLAHPRAGRAPEAAARSRGGAPARPAHARQPSTAPPLRRAAAPNMAAPRGASDAA